MRYITIILAALGFALLGSTGAFAQVCKGLAKSACERNDGCSHVAAFTRKDGARVKAFCRTKPGARRSSSRSASTRSNGRAKTEKASTRRTTAKSGTQRRDATKKSSLKTTAKRKSSKRRTTKKRARKATPSS